MTTSLSKLCQCLSTFALKNFFLTSNRNLIIFILKQFSGFLSLHAIVKSPSSDLLQPPLVTGRLLGGFPEAFSKMNSPTSFSLLKSYIKQLLKKCSKGLWLNLYTIFTQLKFIIYLLLQTCNGITEFLGDSFTEAERNLVTTALCKSASQKPREIIQLNINIFGLWDRKFLFFDL